MKKKILLFSIICGLLISIMPLEVEAQNEIISYIYHKHQGTEESLGGCYGQPVYHVHAGNDLSGGQCYEQIVYHQHTGDDKVDGECYTVPVYHGHTGSEEAEGGCYVKKIHKHGTSCYKTEVCTLKVDSYSNCFSTWYADCFHHGTTVYGEWSAVKSHSVCGQDKFDSTNKMCNSCRQPEVSTHGYKVLNCSRGNAVEGYVRGCDMDETTIVSYDVGCNKTEGKDIDGYALSCPKTEESIESYGLSCGKETTVPVGFVKIIDHSNGKAEKVVLEASYWDNTALEGKEGELKVSSSPFVWENASGKKIGTSSQITVKQNGSYQVTLQTENQDIKREGLSVTIRVTNVKEASGSGGEDVGDSNDVDNNNGGGGNDGDSNHNNNGGSGGENSDNNVITELPGSSVNKVSVPDTPNTPKKSIIPIKKQEIKAIPTASPIIIKPPVKVETKEVKVQELDGSATEIEVQEVTARPSFWATPAARAFVITLGGVVAILGLAGLWILLFRYVGIYGDDGEGNDCFLGFGLIRKEETLLLVIPEHIMDRAYTSRYCLRPAILFYKMHEQSELLVEAKEKKISLIIEKEMTFKY